MTSKPESSFEGFPERDSDWSQDQWKALLDHLVQEGLVSWNEICSLVLGHLNPSQVGTSIASKPTFQKHFPKRETWQAVRQWHFDQSGVCSDCGTRLELQADHLIPKEIVGKVGKYVSEYGISDHSLLSKMIDERLTAELESGGYGDVGSESLRNDIVTGLYNAVLEGQSNQSVFAEVADRLDNMLLRCRRCNVIRRPSHKHGGETFLTTEAGLMWILLVKRPQSYEEFAKECRLYGMTMASVRFEEAWAMAMWLEREGAFYIIPSSKFSSS